MIFFFIDIKDLKNINFILNYNALLIILIYLIIF